MAFVDMYMNPDLLTGANDGTSEANAWQSFDDALSNCVAGQRVNCKNGASRHSTGLSNTTTNSNLPTKLIWFRGYSSTPGDGGLFQVNGQFELGDYTVIERFDILCDFTADAVEESCVIECKITTINSLGEAYRGHDIRNSIIDQQGVGGGTAVSIDNGSAINCIIKNASSSSCISLDENRASGVAINNYLIGNGAVSSGGILTDDGDPYDFTHVRQNVIVDCETGIEIQFGRSATSVYAFGTIENNVFLNCTDAIKCTDATNTIGKRMWKNAFFNCTSNYTGIGDQPLYDLGTLATNPFMDVANLNFNLNDTAGALSLLAQGFPKQMTIDSTTLDTNPTPTGSSAPASPRWIV